MNRSIFQDARFQPTPDQADQARIADSMFDKSEHPIVIEAHEEVLKSASSTQPIMPPAMTSLRVAKA